MNFGQSVVSWQDYEGHEGAGAHTEEDLSGLLKALTAGQDINNPGAAPGVGFPLRVESLERTLRNTTFRNEHVRLWKRIPKLAAFNTVEEYNLITEYSEGIEAFIDEGDLPEEGDSTYERKYAVIKYMGTTRKVSHVMSLVRPAHGNVIAQEQVSGTMHLLRSIERSLFYGDSNLSSIQYDGFVRQILDNSPATNIHDCKGKPLTEDNLNDSAMVVNTEPNYGLMTHLYLNPKNHADLVKSFFPKARYDLMEKRDGMVGLDIRGWTSPAGNVMFEPDTFITPGRASGGTGAPLTNGLGDISKRPSVPTITVAAAAAGTGSDFETADAGAYRYKVVACNRYGKSTPVVVTGSPVTVAAGESVTFTVTEGAVPAQWWEVYRSDSGGAANTEKLILRIARSAATQVLTDSNYWRPGTTIAIGFQMNLEAVSFKQLAPMIKIPLATVDTAIRWMQLIYGTPILYTPGKIFLFRNIGRDPGSIGIAA